MATHEDGYCDKCSALLTDVVYLTFDGQEYCEQCSRSEVYAPQRATKPEARDDGR